ncbi:hepcidin-like [Amphiprion ocellaris]|uniref:Hepcidin n=1 Tax=Amphiprion ocellaris TaxID=80972 RepID=A0AAQ5XTV2_AMPOC|nr:hepcidin-like [Amphiprion ocellaris]
MKTFSVVVAVAVVLTFICIQQSSATSAEVEEVEEATSNHNPAAEHQETLVDSWTMPHNRQKRGFKCKLCCNCCKRGVCGLCCKKKF